MRSCGLTFDMSGSRRQAQPAGGCPLDGGVRRHRHGLDHSVRWDALLATRARLLHRKEEGELFHTSVKLDVRSTRVAIALFGHALKGFSNFPSPRLPIQQLAPAVLAARDSPLLKP